MDNINDSVLMDISEMIVSILDDYGRNYDDTEYGLPVYDELGISEMKQLVAEILKRELY